MEYNECSEIELLEIKCNLPQLIACPPMDKSGTGIELFRLRLVIEDIDMHPRQRPRNYFDERDRSFFSNAIEYANDDIV